MRLEVVMLTQQEAGAAAGGVSSRTMCSSSVAFRDANGPESMVSRLSDFVRAFEATPDIG